jgi:hypothetical protein
VNIWPRVSVALFLFALLALTGCASSTIIKSQALTKNDKDLGHIHDRLVSFVANVESKEDGKYFRLRTLQGTAVNSQQRFSFSLFSNIFLGSQDVPHTLAGKTLRQTVFLDLPPGTYLIDRIALITLEDHYKGSSPRWLYHHLNPPLVLDVEAQDVQFFGQLSILVLGTSIVGEAGQADLRITPSELKDSDVQQLQENYPAVRNRGIRSAVLQLKQ